MPVYNSATYLEEAIKSVLVQTYSDFELIIINDGSTDNSVEVVRSFTDDRIRLHNQTNQGLSRSLNTGLELARGRYIARMDGDDICLPERFEKQVAYLKRHSRCRIVSSTVTIMDSEGKDAGTWGEDVQHTSPADIRNFLLSGNCIAHPTILAEAKLMKAFRYNPAQFYGEDYDLWLRLTAAGIEIHKIPQPLLKYRVHDTSFTQRNNATISPAKKLTLIQKRFLWHQFKHLRFGRYEARMLKRLLRTNLRGPVS